MSDLIKGRLLRRYKRFLADVELADGREITVHCPNTGAMTGCAEPGSEVWLSTSSSKTRKYPHTWELVHTSTGMACIHSARANKIVKAGIEAGLVPGLEAYPNIRSEVKYGQNSRADLLLEGPDGRVFVEVKSVTLCQDDGQGLFPDAVSDRGRKHLRELAAIRDETTRAVMFFCVLHEGIDRVSAAGQIDSRYRDTLLEVIEQGVEVLAWRANVTPEGIIMNRPLPFSVDPSE